jgi:nitroreductase
MSLDAALAARRSVREFASTPLTWREVGQLLWAAQGITHEEGKRTAPSAGATYPLELYVATADGLFTYRPNGHSAIRIVARDVRPDVRHAAGGQEALNAPAIFAFTAVPARTAARYGERAMRYVQIEVGHAAQDLLLEAVALWPRCLWVPSVTPSCIGYLICRPITWSCISCPSATLGSGPWAFRSARPLLMRRMRAQDTREQHASTDGQANR